MNAKLILWISEKRLIIEATLTAFAIGAFLAGRSGHAEVMMVTLSVLAGFYFISGIFLTPEPGGLYGTILVRVANIASAVCVIGILFIELVFVGGKEQLMVGLASISAAALGLLFMLIREQEAAYFPILLRSFLLATLSAWIFLIEQP